jgi:hypothetical protein
MATIFTKWPQYLPNGRKIGPMTLKYANIFHWKTLKKLSKLGLLVRKKCHLATLVVIVSKRMEMDCLTKLDGWPV